MEKTQVYLYNQYRLKLKNKQLDLPREKKPVWILLSILSTSYDSVSAILNICFEPQS